MQEDFQTKKKMLFECLESAEKNLQGSTLEQKIKSYEFSNSSQRKRNRDDYVEKYKHRGSLFKRPNLPINKCLPYRQRPDYEKNPSGYTHYTLDDVSDTSDRMNTTAAFSFLKEIEDRKHNDSMMDEDDESSGSSKIVFKKSVKLRQREVEADPKLDLKKIQSTKVVMPEYVVGEKRQKPKKDKPKDRQPASNSSLRLSHLDEEEDET